MQRYMLRFSYQGTRFQGSQKNVKRLSPELWNEAYARADRNTVQGALETALIRLKPLRQPIVDFAGRTDSGVHALNACAVVDLLRTEVALDLDLLNSLKDKPLKKIDLFYDPKNITLKLNQFFDAANLDIRVMKTTAVRGDFVPRHATRRRYVYRFALPKLPFPEKSDYFHKFDVPSPLNPRAMERYRRQMSGYTKDLWAKLPPPENKFICEQRLPLDMDKFREIMAVFTDGIVHLQFLMASKKDYVDKGVEIPIEKFSRNIEKIEVKQVPPPTRPELQPILQHYDFYEVEFVDESFFRHQIRRMLGVALMAARTDKSEGFTLEEVKAMTKDPNYKVQGKEIHKLYRAPPEGLTYLGSEYDPDYLENETDSILELPVGPTPAESLWRPKIPWEDEEVSKRLMELTRADLMASPDCPKSANAVSDAVKILLKSQIPTDVGSGSTPTPA